MAIDKICPKCGHDDSILQFYAVGDNIKGKDVKACKKYVEDIKDWGMPSFCRGTVAQECVSVHCRTCQFTWCESPEDNLEAETNAFGMLSEDIKRCQEELAKDIKEAMKDFPAGNPFNDGNPFTDGNYFSGDSPDWFKYGGTCR